MLYRPREHSMWDTWIYPHEGRFYLFYLQRRADCRHEVPWYWDSFGLAVSDDLLNWEEIGTVLEQSPEADDWMGTGRTWQVGDRFLVNYSEIRGGVQSIRFAESSDLVHWTKLSADYDLRPNARWYVTRIEEQPEQWVHWDCLNPVPLSDGSWTGFVSSHATSHPTGNRAVVGQARSSDGIHWGAVAPASSQSAPVAEVSGYARFGGRHYVFVSISEGMGPRYDRFSQGRQGSGMWYWCSEQADGPYVAPEHDHLLQGNRSDGHSAYFGTAVKIGEHWLWNHHWRDNEGSLWLAPLKELVEVAPWQLALDYWPGNDGLKGDLVGCSLDTQAVSFPRPVAGRPLCAQWDVQPTALVGDARNACGLATIKVPAVQETGCMVCCDLVIDENTGDGAGIYIGGNQERAAEGLVVLLHPSGRAVLGRSRMGSSTPCLVYQEDCRIPVFPTGRVNVRAIIVRDFVEIYANERLVCTQTLHSGESFEGCIGFWLDRCEARFENLRVWHLSQNVPTGTRRAGN